MNFFPQILLNLEFIQCFLSSVMEQKGLCELYTTWFMFWIILMRMRLPAPQSKNLYPEEEDCSKIKEQCKSQKSIYASIMTRALLKYK
jgi:hypothetical protein